MICRVDVLLTLVGWFLLMLIFCVILAVVTRAVFEISPPPGLSQFTQDRIYKSLQQVEDTKEQMTHVYVKLQRIEDHIGSNKKR